MAAHAPHTVTGNHHGILEKAERVNIVNSTLVSGNITNVDGRKSSFDILKDAVAHAAFHNSAARFDAPKCHPHTRVSVLNKIMDWLRRRDTETWDHFIMWLTGAAGAGKSAIAQSFIELCLQLNKIVVASFFFGRSDATRNHGGAFVATLVYQIYDLVPDVRKDILAQIEADPFIFTRSLELQFITLLVKPLRKVFSPRLPWGSYRVIVIDGLDECLDRQVQQQILRMISKAIREFELPVLFLIASRPEHDINVVFASRELTGIYARLYLDDTYKPDDDIRTFLQDSFEAIKASHPFKDLIPPRWPTPEVIVSLVEKSSGQFIYVATVVRFTRSIRHLPHHRLEIVLNLRPVQVDLPFSQLDEIYRMILSTAEDITRVLYALSIYSHRIAGKNHLDIPAFMSLGEGELDVMFCDLGSLVTLTWIKNDSTNTQIRGLRVLHASLHDFLLDPVRSKEYFLDINAYRTQHVENVLRYLSLSDSAIAAQDRASSLAAFSKTNFPMCHASHVLMERASLFPLTQLFKAAVGQRLTGMPEYIFYIFLPFLRRMVHLDEQWSIIQQTQENELDTIFLYQIPSYHNAVDLRTFLCLLSHSGMEHFVPGCTLLQHSKITCITRLLPSSNKAEDSLLLGDINLNMIGKDDDQYRQCIIRFLQDPARCKDYYVGPDTYATATLHFIRHLTTIPHEFTYNEDYLSSQIVFHKSTWTVNLAHGGFMDAAFNSDLHPFLLLGYIIFFLPRSGKSEMLVRVCQEADLLEYSLLAHFPKRIKLLREAMKNYLERVQYRPSETVAVGCFRGICRRK